MFSCGESSIDRCFDFTLGTESLALIDSITEFFNKYIQSFFSLLSELKKIYNEVNERKTNNNKEEDVLPFQNWSDFQSALDLTRIGSLLKEKFYSFDKKLKMKLFSFKSFVFDVNTPRNISKLNETGKKKNHQKITTN